MGRLWKTDEIEKCPFCGGNAKHSIAFTHRTEYRPSEKKHAKKYRVQVICNRCHSRGKPVSFYSTTWGDCWNVPYLKQKEDIAPWVNLAIDYWNRRVDTDGMQCAAKIIAKSDWEKVGENGIDTD